MKESMRNFAASLVGLAFVSFGTEILAQDGGTDFKSSNLWTFSQDEEWKVSEPLQISSSEENVNEIVRRIMKAIGLPSNFEIYRAPVPLAASVFKDGSQMIFYSQNWMSNAIKEDQWQAIALLAHEIGHHIAYDTTNPEGDPIKRELYADKFAGHMVSILGGSLDDAQRLFRILPTNRTDSHPARSERLEYVAIGWRDAQELYRPPEPDVGQESVATDIAASTCDENWAGKNILVNYNDGSKQTADDIVEELSKCSGVNIQKNVWTPEPHPGGNVFFDSDEAFARKVAESINRHQKIYKYGVLRSGPAMQFNGQPWAHASIYTMEYPESCLSGGQVQRHSKSDNHNQAKLNEAPCFSHSSTTGTPEDIDAWYAIFVPRKAKLDITLSDHQTDFMLQLRDGWGALFAKPNPEQSANTQKIFATVTPGKYFVRAQPVNASPYKLDVKYSPIKD